MKTDNFIKYAVILICAALLMACTSNDLRQSAPVARKGVIDMRGWRFAENGPVSLVGEWEFYWDKMVDAGDFAIGKIPESSGYFSMPGYWKNHPLDNRKLPGKGFATLHLSVLLDNQKGPFVLAFGEMSSAYRFWVNGELIKSVGIVGNSPERKHPVHGRAYAHVSRLQIRWISSCRYPITITCGEGRGRSFSSVRQMMFGRCGKQRFP